MTHLRHRTQAQHAVHGVAAQVRHHIRQQLHRPRARTAATLEGALAWEGANTQTHMAHVRVHPFGSQESARGLCHTQQMALTRSRRFHCLPSFSAPLLCPPSLAWGPTQGLAAAHAHDVIVHCRGARTTECTLHGTSGQHTTHATSGQRAMHSNSGQRAMHGTRSSSSTYRAPQRLAHLGARAGGGFDCTPCHREGGGLAYTPWREEEGARALPVSPLPDCVRCAWRPVGRAVPCVEPPLADGALP